MGLVMFLVLVRSNEDFKEMLVVCWGLAGRGFGGVVWYLFVLFF